MNRYRSTACNLYYISWKSAQLTLNFTANIQYQLYFILFGIISAVDRHFSLLNPKLILKLKFNKKFEMLMSDVCI